MTRIDLEAFEEDWEESVLPHPRRAPATGPDRAARHPIGRVLCTHKGWVDVLLDGEEVAAVYGGAMRGRQVAVGDRVRIRPPRRETDSARLVDRLPRTTLLTRTADDVMPEERVVVANADLVIVVLGVQDREVGARFVDRVLVAAGAGGLQAAVCVNQIDLTEEPELVARYRAIGYPVVSTSASTGAGLDDLKALLAGRWSVLTGHSGVGKSSLTNLLVPDAHRQIGALGRYGGRHTTVTARAVPVPGLAEAWLIDTPGVRSFGIGHVPPDELARHFPELRDLPCVLHDCLHDEEPGCAVPERLDPRGSAAPIAVPERLDDRDTAAPIAPPARIHPDRYDGYRRFLAALRGEERPTSHLD